MSAPKGYSSAQIRLHWLIAALIVFQLIFGEDMGAVWRSFETTGSATLGAWGWAHVVVGIAVLALAIWRLELRWARGVPDAPAGDSARQAKVASAVHWLLYALMVIAPLSGIIAWYGGVAAAAEFHEILKPVFIVLIAGHFVAALYHHFWLKDGLLNRMRTPQD